MATFNFTPDSPPFDTEPKLRVYLDDQFRKIQPALDNVTVEVVEALAQELSDLTDVGVTTPTNRNVLIADGDSWESRALVEADISDLDHTLELSDLTDVGVTTPTNRNVLIADGDSWESRALVEADISDLNANLTFREVFGMAVMSV